MRMRKKKHLTERLEAVKELLLPIELDRDEMDAERKRIKKMKWYKKVWYCITFPIFDLIGKLTILLALFMKVDWKPIPHKVAVGLDKVK